MIFNKLDKDGMYENRKFYRNIINCVVFDMNINNHIHCLHKDHDFLLNAMLLK